ncbi:MAG: TVP38/TMEM64 family protein [Synergistaceae bacterium]|jgi:uncharacterized membrane protein YdjX (TVP38/TMEM64 family)
MEEKKHKNCAEKRSKLLWKMTIILLLLLAIGAYFVSPAYKKMIDDIFATFATGDFTVMREFVARYGKQAAAVSFFLMIFQSIAAPLPAFLITFANASLFGWWQGAILSWSSAMAGAAVCFYIARIMGRDVVEKITSKRGLKSVDVFFARHGKQSIVIARLLPFISFDFVSYAAGLTSMGFWGFFIATGIGQMPATIIYSYVGGMLTGGAKYVVMGLLLFFSLSILIVMMRQLYNEYQTKKVTNVSSK